jgi:phospholipid/cholesterol/gamma-HCH transport system substrate-binding protein
MKEQAAETAIGAVVAVVAAGFLFYAVTRAGGGEAAGGYPIEARFNRIDGISVGADVRMSGVKVGAVSTVALDPATYMAKVTMAVDPKIKVPADSSAKISSDGLLGGAYIAIEPGGEEAMLKPGNEISHTQGTVDLLTVLASAVGGAAKSEDKGAGAQESTTP